MKTPGKKYNGFTLMEVIVVLSITIILLGASVPVYYRLFVFSDMEIAYGELTQVLIQAHERSRSGINNSNHGVYVDNASYVLYQGGDYSTRVTSLDEDFSFPSNISVSGTLEINFQKFTGMVSNTTSIDLEDLVNDNQKTIIISNVGTIF